MFYFNEQRSLGLLTDLYELTMAHAYWKSGRSDDEAVFHLFYRRPPFQGGYAVAVGIASVIDYLQNWHFDTSDLDYLASLRTPVDTPLFDEGFLNYLDRLTLQCDISAVVEGEIVFPFEPLIRVQGPILQAQLLETVLLTLTNFPTLIATKAARMRLAAGDTPIIEFGLRRAQGMDGAMTATRAAYIGGVESTSNTLAGKWLKIPVVGTHAHSWVMAFESELEAFRTFAATNPNNCVFLVDTYDTLKGVVNAIEVGKSLEKQGHHLIGIRLDSGDLTYLSRQAREMLDRAGFQNTKIYASNELSENLIADMRHQGAEIAVWGVGTHLVTGYGQPALDGVYKLSAIRPKGSETWRYTIKFAERMAKISDPGVLQVRRFMDGEGNNLADAIHDLHLPMDKTCEIIDPLDPIRRRYFGPSTAWRDLLIAIFEKGRCIYTPPSLQQSRAYCKQELDRFDPAIKRLCNPHAYQIGMEYQLYQKKLALVAEIQAKQQ